MNSRTGVSLIRVQDSLMCATAWLLRSSKKGKNGDKADRMACAIRSGENRVKSAVSFLRLARRAMSTAMTTMPTTVADIDTDAWQAQAAASNQYRSQYNGHGPDHHRRLRFHWNTPEFPCVRHSTAPDAQYPMLQQWATAYSCGGAAPITNGGFKACCADRSAGPDPHPAHS